MYECNIVEAKDYLFNHHIHHLEAFEDELIGYREELDRIDMSIDFDDDQASA